MDKKKRGHPLYWIKLWTSDILDDPKLLSVRSDGSTEFNKTLLADTVLMLCVATNYNKGGELPNLPIVAKELSMSTGEAAKMLNRLEDAGIAGFNKGTWTLKNYRARQEANNPAQLLAIKNGGSHAQSVSDPAAEPETDEEYAEIVKAYEANFGFITPMIADSLAELKDEHGRDKVLEAMKVALQANAPRLSYFSKVLENWKREGMHGGKGRKSEDYKVTGGAAYTDGAYAQYIEH